MKTLLLIIGLFVMVGIFFTFTTKIVIPAFFFTLKFWVVLFLVIGIVVWVKRYLDRRENDRY